MPFQQKDTLPDFEDLKSVFSGSGQQTKDPALFQTIVNFIGKVSKLKSIFNTRIEDLEEVDVDFAVNTRDIGYWSPLILSLDPGDSEIVLSDTGAPIIIWIPTP